ncbi:hypothetical protein SBRCBS47491_009362 [Sporothrix bragantina]|uniref:Uncharacterized protein n=1 Tax=Sporothrix bragantina TaxID=671064 RepID=A0ABP0CV39_9PEZI
MKVSTLLTTLLVGAGIVSASLCKPSSVRSAVSSSASSSSSTVSSAYPTCSVDPSVNVMGAGTNILTGAGWGFSNDATKGTVHSITTCAIGPTDGCLQYVAADPSADYTVSFSYTQDDAIPGDVYLLSIDLSQVGAVDTDLTAFANNANGDGYFHLAAGSTTTWKLAVTATASTIQFEVIAPTVDKATTLTFNNFAVYQPIEEIKCLIPHCVTQDNNVILSQSNNAFSTFCVDMMPEARSSVMISNSATVGAGPSASLAPDATSDRTVTASYFMATEYPVEGESKSVETKWDVDGVIEMQGKATEVVDGEVAEK